MDVKLRRWKPIRPQLVNGLCVGLCRGSTFQQRRCRCGRPTECLSSSSTGFATAILLPPSNSRLVSLSCVPCDVSVPVASVPASQNERLKQQRPLIERAALIIDTVHQLLAGLKVLVQSQLVNRDMGKVVDVLKAILTRLIFAGHGFIAIWRVTTIKDDPAYWYLSISLLVLAFEGIFTLTIKANQEWRWYVLFQFLCPMTMCHVDFYFNRSALTCKRNPSYSEPNPFFFGPSFYLSLPDLLSVPVSVDYQ
ncbi:hypothetical protein OUZ56_015218 [Daphnia magna]|uniref:Transmembrane protein 26 n=1 Tax=Daphnia magna TaxID=35525 RepID=A0ABR0AM62_9CRUS|nr:hypothetical protein OUZ56_015218 [Daphnia magna]